ncbi:MAG: ATP-binding protein [Victivallales bacterium]|nr:ATP-binding protein [Victivallales bacterium]
MNPSIVKRVVVALYEAEVNAIAHAYGGVVTADIDSGKILLRVIDKGPGIPDIDWAMQEGNSTASPEVRNMGFGAGMGLPNIKKNVDRLNVQSTVGVGTTVEMEVNLS